MNGEMRHVRSARFPLALICRKAGEHGAQHTLSTVMHIVPDRC